MDKKQHNTTLTDKILEKLEEQKVTPHSKCYFLIQENVFWVLWFISIVIGSIAFAATVFALMNVGWRFYLATHDDFLTFFFHALPYVWMSALLIFIFIGYINFKHTKKGYKNSLFFIILLNILASLVGGLMLYAYGFGEIIDEQVGKKIPYYKPVIFQQKEWWLHPERGILAGEVLEVRDNQDFILRDFVGKEWFVEGGDLRQKDTTNLLNFSEVKIVGVPYTPEDRASNIIHACFVFPWEIYNDELKKKTPKLHKAGETRLYKERSSKCKDVRPYQLLEQI